MKDGIKPTGACRSINVTDGTGGAAPLITKLQYALVLYFLVTLKCHEAYVVLPAGQKLKHNSLPLLFPPQTQHEGCMYGLFSVIYMQLDLFS